MSAKKIFKDWIPPLILMIVPFLFNGCREDPYVINCVDGPITSEALPPGFTFAIRNVGDQSGVPLRNLNLVIQSQLEYEYYLKPATYLPNVDFKRKTLLVVRTNEDVNYRVDQRFSINCQKRMITWTKDALDPSNFPNFPDERSLVLAILVPKVYDGTKFEFIINMLN